MPPSIGGMYLPERIYKTLNKVQSKMREFGVTRKEARRKVKKE